MLRLKCSICRVQPEHMKQVNNVFLIVAITALMAILTAIITFFVDMLPPALNGTKSAADAVAIAIQRTWGH